MTRPCAAAAAPLGMAAPGNEKLDWLIRHLAANRMMPVPPASLHNVGDGDWRAIGAEFLGHFVRIGGLRPDHDVLEIGCGTGRMAMPLTQYLDPSAGSYDGVDVVAPGIAWCERAIARQYANFRFRHVDLQNDLYNPQGSARVEETRLPYADASFDFAILTSVITHLDPSQVASYAAEIARLLRPGGRCFTSLFLVDDVAREALDAGKGRLAFDVAAAGPQFYAIKERPLAAVAYEFTHLIGVFAQARLDLVRPVVWGAWSGRAGGRSYQDICIFSKPLSGPERAS
jgi:SAM-dependent methyltransferase